MDGMEVWWGGGKGWIYGVRVYETLVMVRYAVYVCMYAHTDSVGSVTHGSCVRVCPGCPRGFLDGCLVV